MWKTPELSPDGASLESFLSDNQVLLASLAVFAALLTFAKDVPPPPLGAALSFILLGGLILIWLEIWGKLPRKLGGRLFLFRYVLIWGMAAVIFHWVYEYRVFWDIFLWIPYTFIAMWLIVSNLLPVIRSFNFTRSFFGIDREEKTTWHKTVRGMAIVFMVTVSFVSGLWFSVGTNIVLDTLKQVTHE